MATRKARVPAIDGWFTMDEAAPELLGSRCTACGTYAFPRATLGCANPACQEAELEEVSLSRRGRIWSYTDARYQPPAPYVAADPYEPFALAAVELAAERMVVLGQLVPGTTVGDVTVGQEVELVLGTLYEDDEHEVLMWQWRPVAAPAAPGGAP
ncbi:MAG: Zn-ribbon domain-containing OB-fold protein, partial [Acidimicrobiales bacterium]